MPRGFLPSQPPPQDDISPATTHFRPESSTAQPLPNSSSVRRNLFSAHLSRRPASGSQSSSQGSSHPHSQSQVQPPYAQDTQSFSHLPQPHHSAVPSVSRIHAASRSYQHQRSVSSPSLSPSPPRLSPFHNLPPTATFAHNAITAPPLAPTPPRHPTETYDPTVSPHRPLSPRSRETLFPNSSVIAINPATGRPILPYLPVLPDRLKLTDDDDADEEGDEDGDEAVHAMEHHTTYTDGDEAQHHPYSQGQNQGGPSDHSQIQATTLLRASDEASLEADDERRDRERIERLLREMMARQRTRAQGKTTASVVSNSDGYSGRGGTPSNVGSRSLKSRRQVAARRRDEDAYASASGDHDGNEASSDSESEMEAKAEEEELMGLITASLRREVARAEEEGWMFGDSGGLGMGREEGLVGAGVMTEEVPF